MKKLCALFMLIGLVACHHVNTSESPRTKIRIVNNSDSPVTVYITLGSTPGCLQRASLIPFVIDTIGSLVGDFPLQAHDSTIDYSPNGIGYNGNITFRTQPINCANSMYPNGVNIFEFILNNSFQPGIPQETVDISCVAGVNCLMSADLIGGNTWNAGSTEPNVTHIYNGAIDSNSGHVGIFPYGCDSCSVSTNKKPACDTLVKPDKQKAQICNVQRNTVLGDSGLIRVVYIKKK